MKKAFGWLTGGVIALLLLNGALRYLHDYAYKNAPPMTAADYVGDVPVPADLASMFSRVTRVYSDNALYVTLTLAKNPTGPFDRAGIVQGLRRYGCTVPVRAGASVVIDVVAPSGTDLVSTVLASGDCQ